ncbi:MAG TPA: hypothetical protein PK156_48800, partial [Polyangium sp.]|nr:hypothetical protein [Polyangium sp.]
DALWAEAVLAHEDGDKSEACSLATTLRKEFADSRFARCTHLVCDSVKPGSNERACANYIERQVSGGKMPEEAEDVGEEKP